VYAAGEGVSARFLPGWEGEGAAHQ
jgi:hypothetical protein